VKSTRSGHTAQHPSSHAIHVGEASRGIRAVSGVLIRTSNYVLGILNGSGLFLQIDFKLGENL
jgi:hypothetical protein